MKDEALRLADALDQEDCMMSAKDICEAAAELRRLHDLAIEQQGKIYALEMARSIAQKTAKLKRDQLLETLTELVGHTNKRFTGGVWDRARAAIKKVEEA
jgi:hypothetical protein